jgi:acyl carrier protein
MNPDIPALIRFVCDRFSLEAGSVDATTPLFSSGLLDSFHLLELVAHVEEQAGIRISPGEISLDNLDSAERIVRFVEGKRHP